MIQKEKKAHFPALPALQRFVSCESKVMFVLARTVRVIVAVQQGQRPAFSPLEAAVHLPQACSDSLQLPAERLHLVSYSLCFVSDV